MQDGEVDDPSCRRASLQRTLDQLENLVDGHSTPVFVFAAKVAAGAEPTVAMVAPRDLYATVPRGLGSERKSRVVAVNGLKAPIRKGQRVGELIVSVKGLPDSRLTLVAAAAVEEAGPVLAAWHWLKSLLGF